MGAVHVGRAWLAPALGASSRRSSTPRAGAPIFCNVIDSLSAVIVFHLHPPYRNSKGCWCLSDVGREGVSYQIKPTTVWVDPSSTGVTRRRGALRNAGSRAERVLVGPSRRPHPTDRKAGVRHSRELRQPPTDMPARESTPVGDSAPVTRILASAVQDRSAPYPHSWTDRSSTCPRGMQISRSRPRVDHVLTVEFFGKCRESKTPENINVFGGSIWLRGLDLNQRPSGYEFV